ncbi:MAG TPA: MmcQ/YjbR family DNA-binding protein [Xanthobacteraceae bacterium]
MAKALLAFDAVRRVALRLPGVTDSTMYGSPALKVHGNLLACVPVNKSAEPNCAAFRIDFDLRAALIKQNPEIYYITDHYANHPIVLVRLSRIDPKELRDLLGLAWNFVSAKKPTRSSSANASRAARGGRISSRERPVVRKPSGRRQ